LFAPLPCDFKWNRTHDPDQDWFVGIRVVSAVGIEPTT
jgi:hypothetical protein